MTSSPVSPWSVVGRNDSPQNRVSVTSTTAACKTPKCDSRKKWGCFISERPVADVGSDDVPDLLPVQNPVPAAVLAISPPPPTSLNAAKIMNLVKKSKFRPVQKQTTSSNSNNLNDLLERSHKPAMIIKSSFDGNISNSEETKCTDVQLFEADASLEEAVKESPIRKEGSLLIAQQNEAAKEPSFSPITNISDVTSWSPVSNTRNSDDLPIAAAAVSSKVVEEETADDVDACFDFQLSPFSCENELNDRIQESMRDQASEDAKTKAPATLNKQDNLSFDDSNIVCERKLFDRNMELPSKADESGKVESSLGLSDLEFSQESDINLFKSQKTPQMGRFSLKKTKQSSDSHDLLLTSIETPNVIREENVTKKNNSDVQYDDALDHTSPDFENVSKDDLRTGVVDSISCTGSSYQERKRELKNF